jgi:hypothetical protein
MKTSFSFRRALVVLCFAGFALPASAQLQSYEFGAGFRSKKAISEDTDWQMHQKIFGLMMRGHCSVVDFIINRDHDKRFRFGDYLGAAFGTGFTKEQIISSSYSSKLNTMWITIDLQAGLQAAYNVNDHLTVGLNAFKEFQFGFVVMTDHHENIYTYNMLGANVTYGNLYFSYNYGLPWDLTDAEDYDDHISRFYLKFFTDKDKGNNLGLRFESAKRSWYTGRTDRLTTFELSFGRMF